MSKKFIIAVLIIAAGAAAYFAVSGGPARRNLILISLDTLRADRLGAYGYPRDTSPNLDKFAKQGVVFENLVSATSWTLPAHVSIFTGLYPSSHGVTYPKDKVGERTVMLTEILKARGYRTFATTGGGYVGAKYGFDRGFESYAVHKQKKRDGHFDLPRSIETIKQKLAALGPEENFFIFLHTFDAHCPYNSPEPFMSMFNSPEAAEVDPKKCGDSYYNKIGISDQQALYLSDRYDGGVRFVDSYLGPLFEQLESQGRMQDTVVVITSDHGEEFHEHGRIGHKKSLYRELLRIPLIIRAPGLAAGRVKTEVGQVDIFPTVLELLGVEENHPSDGKSLVPLTAGGEKKLRSFQLSELDQDVTLRSHMDAEGHLIRNLQDQKKQFFDLKADPAEKRDISGERQDEVIRRSGELDAVLERLKKAETSEIGAETQEEIEKLRSLGYLD